MDWNTPPTAAEMAASKQDNFESPPTPEEIAASKDPWATPPTAEEMAQSKSHGVSQTARDYLVNGVAFGKGAQLRALMRPRIDLGPDGHVVAGASQDYQTSLASNKADQDAEKAQHPYWATGSEMVGAALPMMAATALTGGAAGPLAATRAARVATAGVNGVLQGAGHSDSNTVGGVAGDSAVGGVLGVGGALAGEGLGAAAATRPGKWLLNQLGRPGRYLLGKAQAIDKGVADKAAQTVGQNVGEARDAFDSELQRGADYVRNVSENRSFVPPTDPVREMNRDIAQANIRSGLVEGALREESPAALHSVQPGTLADVMARSTDVPPTAMDLQAFKIADAESKLKAAEDAAPQSVDALKKRITWGINPKGMWEGIKENWPAALGGVVGGVGGGAIAPGVGHIAGALGGAVLGKEGDTLAKLIAGAVLSPGVRSTVAGAAGHVLSAPVTQGELLRQILAGGSVPLAKSGAPQSAGQYLLEKLQARQGKKNE